MAHCYVAVVSADKNLVAACDDPAVLVDSCVDACLFAAGAYGFDLCYRVRKLKKAATARK